MNQIEQAVFMLAMAAIGLVVLVQIISILIRLDGFLENLRYINMELGRCSAHMRPKWLRRRRRLWCSLLIPFYKVR